ncbi:MAG: CtkA family protein [Erysipelotrichia bacterium]|nr:CtkA family protein [Erysipelotrichia bacterium]NCC54807.1 CtkA family protein [Erysipelotrichia bacterium]
MENFNAYEVNKYKYYDGNNGKKVCLEDKNKVKYMLKTPPYKDFSYTMGCFSEDIGCKIFTSLGFKTQETQLGTYKIDGKDMVCVLCKDFEIEDKKLFKFAQLKNGVMDTPKSGYGVELSSILDTIEEQNIMEPKELKVFFWNMFIADALVGNSNRHNGNWGFLIDEKKQSVEFAPIFDCGSCLYSQLKEENIQHILDNQHEKDNRIYVFPNSAIKMNDEKINYFDFISSNVNQDCTNALQRIIPKIDLEKINHIIDDTEGISALRKTFLKTMIKERKEKILDKSLEIIAMPKT